ncbi:MAG: acyl carrier protein [Opitutae bacterium]|nr:acyl carrier protein [Opitutae bacterium]MCD8298497.1 acyl carrier protein [Opitutae bacterium]
MTLDEFTRALSPLFPQTPPDAFSPETDFKKLPEWSSLLALSVIACVEDEFDILLSGDDISKSQTVRELFAAALSRKS